MEASALLAGLKLAEQFNAQSLVVESDCMEVTEKLKLGSPTETSDEGPSKKKRAANVGYFQDEVGLDQFLCIVFRPTFSRLPILQDFVNWFGEIPSNILVCTNTGCNWRMSTMREGDDAYIDQGWAGFAVAHQLKVDQFLTFKKVSSFEYSVLIFDHTCTEVLWKVLEGSRKVRKKPPRKVESTWDSTSMANPSGGGVPNMASSINFNQFLEKEKLKSNGSNFTDWFRHVRIFLNGGNLQYVLDAPLGDPPETETDEVKNVYITRKTRKLGKLEAVHGGEILNRIGVHSGFGGFIEAVWMKRFIVELGVVPSALDPFVIYCDNMGAIANAQEPRSHKRLKHIKLRYHSIREYIEDGERSSADFYTATDTTPSCVGFKRSYYFRCPLEREVDVVFINNRTCDRVRRCCPFVAPEPIVIKIFYALASGK
ncbi:hypothetical protein QYE76_067266 [Lolium multiflorum]|uniref:TF-B3 domain-containing protein n=1 Tax=Lolium multiflorum TaxID=4521 RepID=A0AAD8SC24_LOLMU|nr:hypothetical protein QYE76_067266 [Lolium multiflorum]